METHVKVLAWLYIVFGALGVLTGLMVWGFLGGIGAIVGASGQPDAEIASPILHGIGGLVFFFLAAISLPSVAAGWGLLNYQEWGRILTIVLSALNLPFVPFGTALGAYGLWVLLNNQTAPLFKKNT